MNRPDVRLDVPGLSLSQDGLAQPAHIRHHGQTVAGGVREVCRGQHGRGTEQPFGHVDAERSVVKSCVAVQCAPLCQGGRTERMNERGRK
jgi:hypothetical protein